MTGSRGLSGVLATASAGLLTLLYLYADMFSVNWVAIVAGFCWGFSLASLLDALAERTTGRRPSWRGIEGVLTVVFLVACAGALTLVYLLEVTPEGWKAMLMGSTWGGTLIVLGDALTERITRRRGGSRAEIPKGR